MITIIMFVANNTITEAFSHNNSDDNEDDSSYYYLYYYCHYHHSASYCSYIVQSFEDISFWLSMMRQFMANLD